MKKHQLRQELRSHLEQVLEEQRPRNSPMRSPQAEYARALQLQIEEARIRESPKSDSGGGGWGGWFDDPQSFQPHFYRTAEQQRLVLLEQMEEAKLKREVELRQRMEDEIRWEAYYARQRHSPVAAAAAAPKPQKTRREIELEIRQLQLQLRDMDDEDEYSCEGEEGEECGGYEDDDFSQEEEEGERVETSPDAQPLKVKSRYFVYVAKPSGMSLPEESNSSSSTNSSSSSSEGEEDQRGTSQAAQAALRRADSSNPLPPLEQQLSINSFLDGSPSSPAMTPRTVN
ncbi:hypothetical protein BASA81_001007 [Batrachochytrium salamandrivorans]|nr:hypothetical protein BASA81_001007 [Batrachochytrium salamandrivorans]